jgi:23S rRNA (adenine2503-C2)-methyltransferase
LTDEYGINISQRNLTVSTCGIVPRMRELAEENLAITLALSLHASNQQKRLELMPVANKYEIGEVIDACKYYFEKTGRRITFEYAMIVGVSDTEKHALELCRRLKGILCHVNLIPVNAVEGKSYSRSSKKSIENFSAILEKKGISVTVRRELGRDINAACGQLRKQLIEEGNG